MLQIRITKEEGDRFKKFAKEAGFPRVKNFILALINNKVEITRIFEPSIKNNDK